jgi:transcriptional regulator with XRE-family HTH domain
VAKLTEEDTTLKYMISERILELRMGTGLSQIDFAKKYDIDRQHINRWESRNNPRGITIYTIQKFCNMIGITLEEFFKSDKFK